MKIKICLVGLLLGLNVPAWASLYSFGTLNSGSSLGEIPDNNTIGTMNLPDVGFTASGLGSSISDLTLTLQLTGPSVSDLTSAYLRLGSGTGPDGGYYDLTGLLSANSANVANGTSFSINFTTTGFQSAFNGVDPNGAWTLFFADTVPGDTTTLNGWSLDIATSAVPEPVNLALAVFAGVALLTGMVRWQRRKRCCRSI